MNILSSPPPISSSILNCVLLDQKHIYEAYKQVLSSKTQNSISLWMWASSEANAALRDIVMRFAELEILVVKLLQGYMKKFVEHRRVLKQVVEEEHNVADVRNQHLDFSRKAAKLSSKVDQHAKKRDSTKLKNLKNELQIARSHEEEKKEQLDAAVLRLEVLKASLVRNSLVMISDAGVRLAQGLEKISMNQHKVSKMIPVIPVHLATPTPNNPSNTTCYPGPDVTNNVVENVAQDIGISRSTPPECSHLCEPLFKRSIYPSHPSTSFYSNTPSSAIVNHPLTKLNLPPPPYSPPSPGAVSNRKDYNQINSPGVHTCRRMNRLKYYQNRESSYNSDGANRQERASKLTDGYDEIHSDEATFDLNDSDFDDNFENLDLDSMRRSRSQTDAAAVSSAVTTPFSSEKQFCMSATVDEGMGDQDQYSQPLRWDPANLLKDAASTNKIFAKVYNQMNGQSAHCEVPNCSQEPYLNLVNKCNDDDCTRCNDPEDSRRLRVDSLTITHSAEDDSQRNSSNSSALLGADSVLHIKRGVASDMLAVDTPQHSVASGDDSIYSNLHHTWSSAPSLPDSCRSCICKNCIDSAAKAGRDGCGMDTGGGGAGPGDEMYSNCCNNCNSYVNYSNSRLRELSAFWPADDVDVSDSAEITVKDGLPDTNDGAFENGFEETFSHSFSEDTVEPTTVQRRHTKLDSRSPSKLSGDTNPEQETSQPVCRKPTRDLNLELGGQKAGVGNKNKEGDREEDTRKDKSRAVTPKMWAPMTPSANNSYQSNPFSRPPNRFGVRKALFRLKNSRLSTSEPNLSKK